jgi:internalin A
MASDLELIKQLEKEIGIELKQLEFDEVWKRANNGFSMDENGIVKGVNLYDINLEKIPLIITKFHHLKILSLWGNKISDISMLKELGNLKELYLNYNQITDISMLKELGNLTHLDLRNNQIRRLPEEILELPMKIKWEFETGEGIFLEGNQLEYLPIEIIKKGKEAIKNYFQSLDGEKQALNEVKVLLVGDGGSGYSAHQNRPVFAHLNLPPCSRYL